MTIVPFRVIPNSYLCGYHVPILCTIGNTVIVYIDGIVNVKTFYSKHST